MTDKPRYRTRGGQSDDTAVLAFACLNRRQWHMLTTARRTELRREYEIFAAPDATKRPAGVLDYQMMPDKPDLSAQIDQLATICTWVFRIGMPAFIVLCVWLLVVLRNAAGADATSVLQVLTQAR